MPSQQHHQPKSTPAITPHSIVKTMDRPSTTGTDKETEPVSASTTRRVASRSTTTSCSSSDDGMVSSASTTANKNPGQVGVPSVSGWNVFVTGLPITTTETQIASIFSNQDWIRVNFDRSTGHCKGYAVVEYSDRENGQDAINRLHGSEFLGSRIGVHWAFVKKPGVNKKRAAEDAGGIIDAASSASTTDTKPSAK